MRIKSKTKNASPAHKSLSHSTSARKQLYLLQYVANFAFFPEEFGITKQSSGDRFLLAAGLSFDNPAH